MTWQVAHEWYRAIRIDDRITRIDEPCVAPLLRCNIWHVRGRDRDLVVDEGDIVDLGDVAFEVLHLPGHSPGSLGLWDPHQRLLLSGDAIYDGPLLDRLPGSSVERYLTTMDRLRRLPADAVHAGHDPSFGRDRLHAIATTYLDRHGGA